MIDPQLAKALIEIAAFLEFSDDETLAPDAAVAAMEQLAANLQSAEEATRAALAKQMRALAASYPAHSDFVANLPEALGIE